MTRKIDERLFEMLCGALAALFAGSVVLGLLLLLTWKPLCKF